METRQIYTLGALVLIAALAAAQDTEVKKNQVGGLSIPPGFSFPSGPSRKTSATHPAVYPGDGPTPNRASNRDIQLFRVQADAIPLPEVVPPPRVQAPKGPSTRVLTIPESFSPVTPKARELWERVYTAVAEKHVDTIEEVQNPAWWDDPPRPPEAEYSVVLADAGKLPLNQRFSTRYLSLYALPPEERFHHVVVTSFVLNSLSWSEGIVVPDLVPGTRGRVMRVDWANYTRGIDPKTGRNFDLERFLTSWDFMSSGDVFFREPWVDHDEATALTAMTGSIGAVLRADWFNFYVMLDDDPNTKELVEGFYSRFRGLPDNEKDFYDLLKVRTDEIRQLGSERRAGVVISGTNSDARKVGQNNRILIRRPTLLTPYGGHIWTSLDYINSQGKRNILNNPLTDDRDGAEYIFTNPNRLHGNFLTQKKQVRVNGVLKVVQQRVSEVPIAVATDPHFDHHRVKMNSCTICHVDGINTFHDVFTKRMFSPVGPAGAVLPQALKSHDIDLYYRLYREDLDIYVKADRINYRMAVERATGMTCEDFVPIYYKTILDYLAPVTADRAAWEFGVQIVDQDLGKSLEMYLADKVVSTTNGTLMLLVRRGRVNRDSFEEEYRWGKLLQEVKNNVQPKGGREEIFLHVPAEVEVQGVILQSQPPVLVATTPAAWKVGATVILGKETQVKSGTEVLGTLPQGSKVKLLGTSSTKFPRSDRLYWWYKIDYNGRTGWLLRPSE